MQILTISNCDLIESQGSGYVIVNFVRGLEARGHTVTAVGPQDAILLPGVNKARSLRLAVGMWQKAAELVKQSRPDIVEFYGAEAWLATDRLSRQRHRQFKIVAHSNGIEPFVAETLAEGGIHNTGNGRPPKWYQGRLPLPQHKAFTCADALVTVSQPEADYAQRRGYHPADRILAIDNALPEEFLDQPCQPERPKTVGYCGSWLARKGALLIPADLATILRQFPDWNLHLVGVGHDFRAGDHFPEDIVPRVRVTGFVSSKAELRQIYRSWAIALMPSIYESFGLVAAEAMACGCALVANRTGYAATLEDGVEAVLLARPVSPHLSDAVRSLIANEPLRRRIAEAGWKRVQSLRWEDSISRIESFYRRLIGATDAVTAPVGAR